MANKINTKKTVKSYQQKPNQGQRKANKYQQETAEELIKADKSLPKATTKTQQKNNQYQHETAKEFLSADKAGANRTGYLIPDITQEAAAENNLDKIMKAGKKETKKTNTKNQKSF
jgi:hypothetical protein